MQRLRTLILSVSLGLLLAAGADAQFVRGAAAARLPKPENFRVFPDFQTGDIVLKWDAVAGARRIEIFRGEFGEALTLHAVIHGARVDYTDAVPAATTEWVYRVEAVFRAGRRTKSAARRQNLKTLWPVPDSHEILHGWQDTIGDAGVTLAGAKVGFHLGVDIQRFGVDNDVVATRGGVIHSIGGSGADRAVNILVRMENGRRDIIQTNHVDEVVVSPGQSVYAGQKLGEVSETIWAGSAVDHVHFVIFEQNPVTKAWFIHEEHPLLLFSDPSDRDPGNVAPGLVDHDGGGTLLFRRQGTGAILPVADPIHGNVDIIVELGDAMGVDPDQIPAVLAYWVEPPAPVCGVTANGVKDGASPYVLLFTDDNCYGCDEVNQDLADAIIDPAFDLEPLIPEYPIDWENFKHYVVTNTWGTTGLDFTIDADEHWNTDAKEDLAAPTSPWANYAGLLDAVKPSDARFPDGDYVIHVNTADLVNNNAGIAFPVRLENFPPYVCSSDPGPGTVFPAGTDEVANLHVFFSEPMDMTVPAAGIIAAHGGATVHDTVWVNPFTIRFTLKDMVDGGGYTLRVSAAAKDRPGTPGGNALDGNDNGIGGDDYTAAFSVAP